MEKEGNIEIIDIMQSRNVMLAMQEYVGFILHCCNELLAVQNMLALYCIAAMNFLQCRIC